MSTFSSRIDRSGPLSGWNASRRHFLLIASLVAICSTLAFTSGSVHSSATQFTCVASPHSGEINTSQDCCPEDNPHILSGSVTIKAGTTVNIRPGVEVRVEAAKSLLVYGTLMAVGTSGDSILFTSSAIVPAPNDWVGMQVWNGSTVHMDYVDLAYAGRNGNRAIYVQSGSDFQINHSRVHHNQGYGIVLVDNGLSA